MDTKPNDKEAPRPEEQNEAKGSEYFQSPEDFYNEMRKRPDIREILAKLAKLANR